MNEFLVSEVFRLELHWEKAKYNKEGHCELEGAYFSGPVLAFAQEISENDNIMLDFYSQYIVLIENVYIGKLSWNKVTYIEDGKKVLLENANIFHATELNRVPNLRDSDFIVIDTKGHEAEYHANNLLYKAYVIDSNKELYNFKK